MEDRLPLQKKRFSIQHQQDHLLHVPNTIQEDKKQQQSSKERRSIFRMRSASVQQSQQVKDDQAASIARAKKEEKHRSFMVPKSQHEDSSKSKSISPDRNSRKSFVVKRTESNSISDALGKSPSRNSNSSLHRMSVSRGNQKIKSPESNSRSGRSPLTPYLESKENIRSLSGSYNPSTTNSRAASVNSTLRLSSKNLQKLKMSDVARCALFSCQELRAGRAYCREHLVTYIFFKFLLFIVFRALNLYLQYQEKIILLHLMKRKNTFYHFWKTLEILYCRNLSKNLQIIVQAYVMESMNLFSII
jgi:hypothetical protein